MEIDNETKKQILRDYRRIHDDITKILNGSLPNLSIRGEDYITPTISAPKLPLNDRNGYLQYLVRIRGGLESLLTEGKAPDLPAYNLPSYLTKILEE